MNILALDLATKTGWALDGSGVLTCGVMNFKSQKHEGGGFRFLRFEDWLRKMISEGKPDVVYYESVRRHLAVDAAHVYGGLLAVMQKECERKQVPYCGLEVSAIKITATGKGNAKKDAMIAAAERMWPDQHIEDDNVADALWILETAKRKNLV